MSKLVYFKDGKVFNSYNLTFSDLAIIIDRNVGILKYGEPIDIQNYYEEMYKSNSDIETKYTVEKILNRTGIKYEDLDIDKNTLLNNTIVITLDGISLEYKAILVNYLMSVSANHEKMNYLLELDIPSLISELEKLKKEGF